MQEINQQYWRFDLGHAEAFQVSSYRKNDFYGWHEDFGYHGLTAARLLSVSVQVSGADDYSGGSLELRLEPGEAAGAVAPVPFTAKILMNDESSLQIMNC